LPLRGVDFGIKRKSPSCVYPQRTSFNRKQRVGVSVLEREKALWGNLLFQLSNSLGDVPLRGVTHQEHGFFEASVGVVK